MFSRCMDCEHGFEKIHDKKLKEENKLFFLIVKFFSCGFSGGNVGIGDVGTA